MSLRFEAWKLRKLVKGREGAREVGGEEMV